jgi:hypothetical protein
VKPNDIADPVNDLFTIRFEDSRGGFCGLIHGAGGKMLASGSKMVANAGRRY